jgi:hypothetical protein
MADRGCCNEGKFGDSTQYNSNGNSSGCKIESLMENGRPISSTEFSLRCRESDEGVVIELFSGKYTFTY